MRNGPVPRPFLKWAGGKTRLTDRLIERMPIRFHGYHEPCVGGGALFFRLYREQMIRRAVLSDLNAELIDTYVAIRDAATDVMALLAEFPPTEAFYYDLRAKDPWQLSRTERAARMIYLNKTGYNGLYRVNRQGQFNVPFGRPPSPTLIDQANLLAVAHALHDVELVCASFETVLERAAPGDYVYFDPPYVPVSRTACFTAYQAHGFGWSDHERLRDVCRALSDRGVSVMISHADTDSIRSLYRLPHFVLDEVVAHRTINCNGTRRGPVRELIITTYPIDGYRRFRHHESCADCA